MIPEETICPYTGLRSFTEEESLYFKGREEQILSVVAQLEERKFLMLTGASGDGKSSLVFAGLIPQARAGFFKARYSNWHVADFRPERSPLKNMAAALSRALRHDPASVETELGRGFSSLVELYKSSLRYADPQSAAYRQAAEEERERLDRESGNLLILIDQFEEFFTNPENFPGGVPSQESRLLLNIVLETAKISLKEDLPIYIVCTMRSDYIGQCAAFRGLPEFIGFSQFFVPRLQRKELYQVIEEPAILSGNRISKRLIDRLIVDVEEGTDQLPILQHALKEIWKAADSGREEMDLLHYAMVGGMQGDHLPKEVKDRFQTWKNRLPEHEQAYLEKPGLANVLDIHANKLYEGAALYCQQHGHPEVTARQARFIIGMSFACLTRIDESRAVRNRMTLEEITRIVNVSHLNEDVVGTVLGIFREPGNTLLRPYIQEQSGQWLAADAVLDITHESLIRNWRLLKKWSDQEFEYYTTFLDFQQQVNRWIQHGKSDDFLLPIGPLTYFENWYKRCRPNQYWINRYHAPDEEKDARLRQSAVILKNGKEFLRKSALRLFVTRTFMKYGAGRIAAMVGVLTLLVVVGVSLYTWRTRQNDYVLNSILKEGEVLLQDKELISFDHAYFTAIAERIRPGYFSQVIKILPEQKRIEVAANFLTAFVNTDPRNPPPILRQSLLWTDSLVRAFGEGLDSADARAMNLHLSNLNALVRNLAYYHFFNPDEAIDEMRRQNARSQALMVKRIMAGKRPRDIIDMKVLHIAITDAMNYHGFTENEIHSLIRGFSPLTGDPAALARFREWFPREERTTVGFEGVFSHNGGYQALAYWHASLGDVKGALKCIDSLTRHNPGYEKLFVNSTSVAAYFLMYGYPVSFREFVKARSQQLGIPAFRYNNLLLDKVGLITRTCELKFLKSGNFNDNFAFLSDGVRSLLFQLGREFIRDESASADALNYNLALLTKLEGILSAGTRKQSAAARSDSLFKKALSYFGKVSVSYLNEQIELHAQTGLDNSEKRILPRKHVFLYPGHFKSVDPALSLSQTNFYNDSFFHFMLRENLFALHYRSLEDYQLVTEWISTYFTFYQLNIGRAFQNYPDPGQATFLAIDSLVRQSGFDLDNDWVRLVLVKNYLDVGDTVTAYQRVRNLTFKAFEKPHGEIGFFFRRMVIRVASELAVLGKTELSLGLLSNFSNQKNRLKAYGRAAVDCQRNNRFSEAALFFDSANAILGRLKNYEYQSNDFRLPLVELLALHNTRGSEAKALEYIGSMQWFNRSNGIYSMSQSYAHIGEYYKATRVVPANASYYDKVFVFWTILFEDTLKKEETSDSWDSFDRVLGSFFNSVDTQNDLLPD